MIPPFLNVQPICRCLGLVNGCATEAGYFQMLPRTQRLQHCGDLAFTLTHSFADLYGSLQKEPRVRMDCCGFPLLPAGGTYAGLKKVQRGCAWELWFVSSLCRPYSFWYYKVDPSG